MNKRRRRLAKHRRHDLRRPLTQHELDVLEVVRSGREVPRWFFIPQFRIRTLEAIRVLSLRGIIHARDFVVLQTQRGGGGGVLSMRLGSFLRAVLAHTHARRIALTHQRADARAPTGG